MSEVAKDRMPGAVVRSVRYARTLRHLKPWQVVGRMVAAARRRIPELKPPQVPETLDGAYVVLSAPPQHDPWNKREELLAGRFCFLNRTADIGWEPDWKATALPLLWQFNLHYFQYLHLLAHDEKVALCRSWARHNRLGSVGWHSYPTSLRIVNWCRANLQEPDLQESLYRQAAHLYRNLETYVYGNHVLENARALVHAGHFFRRAGEADAWLIKGLQILERQTGEQILSDGGHFERSPMYHALMLEGYLDVLNLLPTEHTARSWILETTRSMCAFLQAVTHPDGKLALFNDATHEIALAPSRLRQYAEDLGAWDESTRSQFPQTGYFTFRDDDVYLVVDGGAPGPDYLMAHAHADVMSYELSLGGVSFVVDSGVYEYDAGPMRDYVRSTRAHNTLAIDHVDQIECWGSFRVARRDVPRQVSGVEHAQGFLFQGVFEGYGRVLGDGLSHRRVIKLDRARRLIEVRDEVSGRGVHDVESRIHLHPDVNVRRRGAIEFVRDGVKCTLLVDDEEVRWEESWYCPEFGTRRRRPVVVIGGRRSLPVTIAYSLRY